MTTKILSRVIPVRVFDIQPHPFERTGLLICFFHQERKWMVAQRKKKANSSNLLKGNKILILFQDNIPISMEGR